MNFDHSILEGAYKFHICLLREISVLEILILL